MYGIKKDMKNLRILVAVTSFFIFLFQSLSPSALATDPDSVIARHISALGGRGVIKSTGISSFRERPSTSASRAISP